VECRDGVLCADARSKRPGIAGNPSRFPNVVTSLPEVVRKVDERWAEYGLGERLESPSDRYRTLLLSDKAAW
jgi:4-hydroxy-3-polyprenylbenzoate decarboxylase